MYHATTLIAATCWIVAALAASTHAQLTEIPETPFFWDEFERAELTEDTDIRWRIASQGQVDLEDGSAILTARCDCDNVDFFAETKLIGDFRLRTQFRFLDDPGPGLNPWIGLYGREIPDDGSSNGYWAGPAVEGSLWIGEVTNGNSVIRSSRGVY